MKIMDQEPNAEASDSDWKRLYRVGGVAALIAGVLFRRNIAAEIGLFSNHKPPVTVNSWFALLQSNRLLGLSYLNIFDIVNYALLGLMFLALYAVLKRVNKSYMAIATTLGFLGISVYFASNTAFSMLSLSDQYAAATTDAQRTMLLAAGQAMLAPNHPSLKSTGATIGWGMDDPCELEAWAPGLRLLEEWYFTDDPDLVRLSLGYRVAFRLAGAFKMVRRAHRIVYYQL